MKPTPEEKCSCGNKLFHNEVHCMTKPSPSPEARVDWEKEARKYVEWEWDMHNMVSYESAVSKLANVLSAAFEKGREAR